MVKKIVSLFLLAALFLIPMNSQAALVTIRGKGSVSKYVQFKSNDINCTVGGVANYDKNGGLLGKDYVSWSGSISHNRAECATDYTMFIHETKQKKIHLPDDNNNKTFRYSKNVKTEYCYAKLNMDTPQGKYGLYVDE